MHGLGSVGEYSGITGLNCLFYFLPFNLQSRRPWIVACVLGFVVGSPQLGAAIASSVADPSLTSTKSHRRNLGSLTRAGGFSPPISKVGYLCLSCLGALGIDKVSTRSRSLITARPSPATRTRSALVSCGRHTQSTRSFATSRFLHRLSQSTF